MFIIQDLYTINKEIIKKTLGAIGRYPSLMIVSFGALLFNQLVLFLAYNSGVLAGLVLLLGNGIIFAAVLSSLENVVRFKQFKLNRIHQGTKVYFRRAVIAMIIVEISIMILTLLGQMFGSIGTIATLAAMILGFIFFNPIPEMLYLSGYTEGDTFKKAIEFIRENWFEWFVFQVPVFFILYQAGSIGGITNPVIGSVIGFGVRGVVIPVIMVYRGFLYDFLSRSSRRKRMFKRTLH